MKVMVLGAGGMLGATLVPYFMAQGHQVTTHTRTFGCGHLAADLTNRAETARMLAQADADTVVNLVGLTDVERCESEPKEAWLANVHTVENVAAATRVHGMHLIHVSTDQVYDRAPVSTEDQAIPGNHYAMTKYAGELAALPAQATVLRTNFFGASRHSSRRSLTDWLSNALKGDSPIPVFEDVRFSPLSMATLCEMIELAAHKRLPGVFNLGSHSGMSKADFAFVFARALGVSDKLLTRSSTSQANFLTAWRPKDMCMNSARFEMVFDLVLPSLEDEIQRAAKDYREPI